MSLRVQASGLEQVARDFQQFPGAVAKAERRAFKRTADWVKSQGAKAMALESAIQQSKLKKARRVLSQVQQESATVFLGTRQIKAGYIGNPQQQARGVRVGKHKFAGAFVATLKSRHVGVFQRRGKARLPIDEQSLPVNLSPAEFQRIADAAGVKLTDEFGNNLEYYAGLR